MQGDPAVDTCYEGLPWTVRRTVREDAGRYYVATVEELPGFSVVGETEEELKREFPVALRCHLESYLSAGEEPPQFPTGASSR